MDRLERLHEERDGEALVLDRLDHDPIEAGLFQQYVDSLPTGIVAKLKDTNINVKMDDFVSVGNVYPLGNKVELNDLLSKRKNREGLRPKEGRSLQQYMSTYIERKKKADIILGNLGDEGIENLGIILAEHTITVDPHELPLYIKGLAVRGTRDFDKLVAKVTHWKREARDKGAQKRTDKFEKKLYKSAERYGISREEVDRFMLISDDKLRMQEFKAALGRSSGAQRILAISRTLMGRSRPGYLNDLARDIRNESANLREGLGEVLTLLAGFDTSRDRWWKDIPEALLKKAEMDGPEDERPVTLAEAREMSSVQNFEKEWNDVLAGIPGARERFDALRAEINAGEKRTGIFRRTEQPKDIWKETIEVNGAQKSFGELFSTTSTDFASKIESTVHQRGWISEFIRALFTPMMKNNTNRAKDRIASAMA